MEIYGTLGPAVDDEEILRQMFAAGMTGMRLNLSHTTLAKSRRIIDKFHAASAKEGVHADFMIDLQGPEMRIGSADSGKEVLAGRSYEMVSSQRGGRNEDSILIPREIAEAAQAGDCITVDDGKISFVVQDIMRSPDLAEGEGSRLSALCKSTGVIQSSKSIAILNKSVTGEVLTPMDRENLGNAAEFGVTSIMQPFVRGAGDLKIVRSAMEEFRCAHMRLFAKIENEDGVKNLPDIMPHCEMIVIARGDLGNAYPLWELPVIQRRISDECADRKQPFLVVTQMLASMERHPCPTRAEVSDIFRAVTEGASAVMVTGETAAGQYPAETMKYLVNTVKCAQEWMREHRNGDGI